MKSRTRSGSVLLGADLKTPLLGYTVAQAGLSLDDPAHPYRYLRNAEYSVHEEGGIEWHYRLLDEGAAALVGCSPCPEDMVIPGSFEGVPLTLIGPHAFSYNKTLRTVVIPDSVTRICACAFMDSGLTSFTAPASLDILEDRVLASCASLAQVNLNEGLAAIGGKCFAKSALQQLRIPASVAFIGNSILSGTSMDFGPGKEPVQFAEGSSLYRVGQQGGLYLNVEGRTVFAQLLNEEISTYQVEEGTEEILPEAFARHGNLETVLLPEGVRIIGDGAFRGNRRMTGITLPESLEIIGDYAFADTPLRSIHLPSRVAHLGVDALHGSKKNPTSSERFLEEVSVSPENAAFYMESGCLCRRALEGEDGDTIVAVGAVDKVCVIPPNVTSVGSYAFEGITSVEELILGGNLKSVFINGFAFGASPQYVVVEEDGVEHRIWFDRSNDSITFAFPSCTVAAWDIYYASDRDISLAEDQVERFLRSLRRMKDPVLLSGRGETVFRMDILRSEPSVLKIFAEANCFEGIELLDEMGFITDDVLDDAVRLLSDTGEVAALGYLLRLKQREQSSYEMDFDL